MKFFVLLIILGIKITAGAGANPRPDITVFSNIQVTADKAILLKDIAQVGNVAADLEPIAGELVIYEALAAGQKMNLKNINIVRAVRNRISEAQALGSLAWTYFVPENVTIEAHKNYINKQAVVFDITQQMRKKCHDCVIKINDLKMPNLNGVSELKDYQIDYSDLKLAGSFLLPLNIYSSAGPKITHWISGSARISKMGPVAQRRINVGERITSADVRLDLIDITHARDGVPTIEEINNQLSGKVFSVNQPIFKSDIRRELAIKRGQAVKLMIGTEDFEIVASGVSEEQGYVGDLIKIKNTETQKLLSGKIIENGIVRVQ